MIFSSYIESFKEYVFKNKSEKLNASRNDHLDALNISHKISIKSNEKSNKEIKLLNRTELKSKETICQSIKKIKSPKNFLSKTLVTFESDLSSESTVNIESLTAKSDSILNRINYPINHECIESKFVRTRLNQSQPKNGFDEQKCIHQVHPECLNLSNIDEGCLVCNALIVGQKYEISTSFNSPINSPNTVTQQNLLSELNKLIRIGWYWGKLTRFEAENKLLHTPPGTFLIRDSFDNNYILSLSFRIKEGVFHTRIEFTAGYFQFYLHPNKKYKTVPDLVNDLILCSKTGIHYYVKSRKTGKEILFKIKIDRPLSRFDQVKSLKYLCRFTIKQNIRYDLIKKLPIPDAIKTYLEENHF